MAALSSLPGRPDHSRGPDAELSGCWRTPPSLCACRSPARTNRDSWSTQAWFPASAISKVGGSRALDGRRDPRLSAATHLAAKDDAGKECRWHGIVSLLILGLLAGALAKWLLPGDDPGGVLVTMLIGVVGALLGGFLAGALFGADPLGAFFELSTWVTAVAGSIVLLLLYRMITRRRRTV
jgi:uncharacterized membrane protein YeaQ/YmgE (transglycosylase-associated protein family)